MKPTLKNVFLCILGMVGAFFLSTGAIFVWEAIFSLNMETLSLGAKLIVGGGSVTCLAIILYSDKEGGQK